MDKYQCCQCEYKTDKKYNYDRHLSKHEKSDLQNSKIECRYCKKLLTRSNISRHEGKCKTKYSIEFISELKYENRLLKNLNTTYLKIINDLIARPTVIINNNINVTYNSAIGDIVRNCSNSPNIEDLADIPLTKKDIKNVEENCITFACVQFLKDRCIRGVDPKNFSFYCTDPSRNMYITKTNGVWKKDPNGKIIETYMKDPIILYVVRNMLTENNLRRTVRYMKEIKEIVANYQKKVLNSIKYQVVAKNCMTPKA